jgi:GNAT superfamily N-acetyltransferase
MTPEVRSATEDDSAAIASLWLDWGREYESLDSVLFRVPSEDGLAGWFRRQIAEATDDELWLVGESRGEVEAFERAVVWRPDDDAKRSLVVDDALTTLKVGLLMVKPSARRSGIGTALTSAAERWGRDRGAVRAVVMR